MPFSPKAWPTFRSESSGLPGLSRHLVLADHYRHQILAHDQRSVICGSGLLAKEPLKGPKAVLAYRSCYTHRVAISNRRLISADHRTVTFKWKDYRADGAGRYKTMTLEVDEFIRRFLIHVFPKRFHRIRHYGRLANGNRAKNVKRARQLLNMPEQDLSTNVETSKNGNETKTSELPCLACGGRMKIIEFFEPGNTPTHHRQRAPPNTQSMPS